VRISAGFMFRDMVEQQQKLEQFKFRLKHIGQLANHDAYWKEIFISYQLEWQDWWDDYCEGFHNLVGHISNDIITDEEKKFGVRKRFFSSIFDKEIENLFIKWLFEGRKEDLKPFYDWFVRYMNRKKEEVKKEQKLKQMPEKTKKEKGYIYLLKSKNLYKIGRAKHLKERIKTYRAENPFGIKVIFQKKVDDYIGEEIKFLEKFKDKNYKGEWFKLNQEDIQWIKQSL